MPWWRRLLIASTVLWGLSMFLPVIKAPEGGGHALGFFALLFGLRVAFESQTELLIRCMFLAALVGNLMILPAALPMGHARVRKFFALAMGVGLGGALAIGLVCFEKGNVLEVAYYVWAAALGTSFAGCVWGCLYRPSEGPRGFEVLPPMRETPPLSCVVSVLRWVLIEQDFQDIT